jgi:hypothetical protein
MLGIAIIFRTDDQNHPSFETTGREASMAVQDTLKIDTTPYFPKPYLPSVGITRTDGDDWDDEEEDEDEDAKEEDEEEVLEKDDEDEDDDLIQSTGLTLEDT